MSAEYEQNGATSLVFAHPATLLPIAKSVSIPLREIELNAIRAQGAGGQKVNKVSSAIHLRFQIQASSLPDVYKQRLLALRDQRISKDGAIVIKAQDSRRQEQNKTEALQRLQQLIQSVAINTKTRKPTKPTLSSRRKRIDRKIKHGRTKALRGRVKPGD